MKRENGQRKISKRKRREKIELSRARTWNLLLRRQTRFHCANSPHNSDDQFQIPKTMSGSVLVQNAWAIRGVLKAKPTFPVESIATTPPSPPWRDFR